MAVHTRYVIIGQGRACVCVCVCVRVCGYIRKGNYYLTIPYKGDVEE